MTPKPMRPSEMRRMINDAIAKGATVRLSPDGTIEIKPSPPDGGDPFDQANMSAR